MAGINDIAKETGINAQTIKTVIEAIRKAVASGERVQIQGFGTFKLTVRAARIARNPRTGEEVQVPEKKVMVFKAS